MKSNNKKAEMAMGTLIIFIAMILIAAVAAAVLITTISGLQTKALETGKATRQEIGTNLQVIEISGVDGSGSSLINLTALLKLSSGSDQIRFNDLLLTVGLKNVTAEFKYDANANCTNLTASKFAVQYAITGSNNVSGYLTKGDVAKVCFIAPRAIVEAESVRLSLIPKVGTPVIIETMTPDTLSKTREIIFP
jgi:flagellin FlaB